jgi:hypothetical protein
MIPVNIKKVPAFHTEGVLKEQMIGVFFYV